MEAFDRAAFITALVAQLGGGIDADDITLTLAAASLRITITVATRNQTIAQDAQTQFTAMSTTPVSELSTALGVQVTAAAAAPTMRESPLVAAATTQDGDGGDSSLPIPILAGAGGGGVLVLALVVCCICMRCSRNRKATQLLNTYPAQGVNFSKSPTPTLSPRAGVGQLHGSVNAYL